MSLEGIDELERESRRVNRFSNNYKNMLFQFMDKMSNLLLAEVKRRTPVDSGTLRASWHLGEIKVRGNKVSVQIINDAKKGEDYIGKYGLDTAYYASFVEKGHRGVYNPKLDVTIHKDSAYTNGVYMLETSIALINRVIKGEFDLFFDRYKAENGFTG